MFNKLFPKSINRLLAMGVMTIVVPCLLWAAPVFALEDPTRPPGAEVQRSSVVNKKIRRTRWKLTSTLVSAGRRTAVINDRVVSPGERIRGATVVSIQPSSVRLREKGREITLVMLKKNIKSLSRTQSLISGSSRPRSQRQGK